MMHTIYNCAFFVAIKKPSRGWNPGALICARASLHFSVLLGAVSILMM
jgi:hypothetical protein